MKPRTAPRPAPPRRVPYPQTPQTSAAWIKAHGVAVAELARQHNNGVADGVLQAQASMHGFVIKTDDAGKAVVESMKKAEQATKDVGTAAKDAAAQMDGMANAAWAAGGDLVEQARRHNAALGEIKGTWFEATAAASKYAREMAELVFAANKNVQAMRREHAALVEQMEALERQQRQLQSQGSDAARGVDDLRLRLLELNGTEDEIAKARQARELEEVRRKQALLQLDLQRAQIGQKQEDAERLAKEIALLDEQLSLLGQIAAAEKKQREQRQEEAKRDTRSSSQGTNTSGSGGGGGAPASFSVTLNANGVNDPAALARMIEPELKKMARLAR